MAVSDLADRIAHVFLPNKCAFCGVPVRYNARRCPECEANAVRTDPSRCLICGRAACSCDRPFEWLVAPFYYDMGVQKAIIDLKFHNNLLNARKLGADMAEVLRQTGLHQKIDLAVPVPLHPADFSRRGYNQAEELARWVARELGLPLHGEALEKLRRTAKQHELESAEQRMQNLKGAFRTARPECVRGKTVLLVDDVFTTGSTMDACASALKAGGARLVVCLAAAKTRREGPVKPTLPENGENSAPPDGNARLSIDLR